nr:uncharacterized protein LOC111837123 isoform X1 [Paramormyrops kingsleyae]
MGKTRHLCRSGSLYRYMSMQKTHMKHLEKLTGAARDAATRTGAWKAFTQRGKHPMQVISPEVGSCRLGLPDLYSYTVKTATPNSVEESQPEWRSYCLPAREDPSHTVPRCGAPWWGPHPSSKYQRATTSWNVSSAPYGRSSNDAHDGAPSPWYDAWWGSSQHAPPHG